MAANHHIRSSTLSNLSYSEGFTRDLFYGDGGKFNVRGDPGIGLEGGAAEARFVARCSAASSRRSSTRDRSAPILSTR